MGDASSIVARTLAALVAVAAVGAAGYYYTELVKPACSDPIAYSIGTLDDRFGVDKAYVERVLQEATVVWNTAAGKELFVYGVEGSGALPVNFIYDNRQETALLGKVIGTKQSAYDQKKSSVDAIAAEFDTLQRSYENKKRTYEERSATYAQKVANWNAKGGAPDGAYQQLEAERKTLERERQALNRLADEVNEMVKDVNKEVRELNEIARDVNAKASVYNEHAGEDFDQGQYLSDESGERIQIYQFENRAELVRVLTHEFGHALGIGHNENPNSIMYSYNLSNGLSLTEDDLAALKETCELE